MTWREVLHPRDPWGRFIEANPSGSLGTRHYVFDRMAAQVENQQHARTIARLEHLWRRQFDHFQPLQAAGKLTPEQDAEWDRNIAERERLSATLPPAYHRRMVPHDDGTWRFRPGEGHSSGVKHDAEGERLDPAALQGLHLVGENPSTGEGMYHQPGEFRQGLPLLRDERGHPVDSHTIREVFGRHHLGNRPERHKRWNGPMFKAELRGERRVGREHFHPRVSDFTQGDMGSPEVFGQHLRDPLNPVGSQRTARKRHRRKQTTTWVQRLNAQMGG